MDKTLEKETLKRTLLQQVARFCRRDRRQWKAPIVETLRDLREVGVHAVFFGGTLRSLLVERVYRNRVGRPRDVDIVVAGATIDVLRKRFAPIIARETRFGGLQLHHREWHFDVWPLLRTWAFVHDLVPNPKFDELPSTTFFNLEAIAAEVWARPGQRRQMFSGDDQFFEGVRQRIVEINREDNPFPELCVVRGLILARSLDFSIGPRLARYIAQNGAALSADAAEEVQRHHYGDLRIVGKMLREWIDFIAGHDNLERAPIRLPILRQRQFWPDKDDRMPRIRVHALAS